MKFLKNCFAKGSTFPSSFPSRVSHRTHPFFFLVLPPLSDSFLPILRLTSLPPKFYRSPSSPIFFSFFSSQWEYSLLFFALSFPSGPGPYCHFFFASLNLSCRLSSDQTPFTKTREFLFLQVLSSFPITRSALKKTPPPSSSRNPPPVISFLISLSSTSLFSGASNRISPYWRILYGTSPAIGVHEPPSNFLPLMMPALPLFS